MGVPGFYAWLIKKFQSHSIQYSTLTEPPRILYIDANCAFHPICFQVRDEFPTASLVDLEHKMIRAVLRYLKKIITDVNPTTTVYIAVDGVPPLAKIVNQRKRRCKSRLDFQIVNKLRVKYDKPPYIWNNTELTPGTFFMEKLHQSIQNFCHEYCGHLEIIYSSYQEPGEGEHKIMQHLRTTYSHGHPSTAAIVIYGLDADLIFLSMATGIDNIYLYRESPHDFTKLYYASIDRIKYLCTNHVQNQICMTLGTNNLAFNVDQKVFRQRNNFINDLIVLCMLLGNDFIPPHPSLNIYRNDIDVLLDNYINVFLQLGEQLFQVTDRTINFKFLNTLFKLLSKGEFKRIKNNIRITNNKPRESTLNLGDYQDAIWEHENLGSHYTNVRPIPSALLVNDNCFDWKQQYYAYVFGDEKCPQQWLLKLMTESYIEGLLWITEYYFVGCPDTHWFYPYDYAPMFADLFRPQLKVFTTPRAIANCQLLTIADQQRIINDVPSTFMLDRFLKNKVWAYDVRF